MSALQTSSERLEACLKVVLGENNASSATAEGSTATQSNQTVQEQLAAIDNNVYASLTELALAAASMQAEVSRRTSRAVAENYTDTPSQK